MIINQTEEDSLKSAESKIEQTRILIENMKQLLFEVNVENMLKFYDKLWYKNILNAQGLIDVALQNIRKDIKELGK